MGLKSLLTIIGLAAALTGCQPSVEATVGKGDEALAKGDFLGALLHFKTAVSTDPLHLGARKGLGSAFEKAGEFASLEQQLRKQIELGENAEELKTRIAILLLDKADFHSLIQEFSDLQPATEPRRAVHASVLSIAYTSIGKLVEARNAIRDVTVPSAAKAVAEAYTSSITADRAKTYQLTAQATELALADNLTPWWVWKWIARGWQSLGEVEKSIAAFDRSLTLVPRHTAIKAELAEYLVTIGKMERARLLLSELQKSAPTFYRTLIVDSLIELNEGNNDRAYSSANKALASVKNLPTALLVTASIDVKRNNLATAEGRINTLLSFNPRSVSALQLLAAIDVKRGMFEAAENKLTKALQLAPTNFDVKVELAQQKLNVGRFVQASELLEEVLSQKPDHLQATGLKLDLLTRTGSNPSAVRHLLMKAASFEYQNLDSLQFLFNLAIKTKDHSSIAVIIEKAKLLKPDSPAPWLWSAILADLKKDPAAVQEMLSKSLKKDPTYFAALVFMRSQVIFKNDASLEARTYGESLAAAVATKTNDPRIYLESIRWQRSQKVPLSAIANAAKKFVDEVPDSPMLRKAVAQTLMMAKRNQEADSVIQQGMQNYSSVPGMLELAAQWAEESGKNEDAYQLYEKLARAFPEHMGHALKKGQLLFKLKRIDDAIMALQKAVDLRPNDEFANRELAFSLYFAGRKQEAMSSLDTFEKARGQNTAGLLAKADLYFFAKDFANSSRTLDRAFLVEPKYQVVAAKVRFLDSRSESQNADKFLDGWLKLNQKREPEALIFAAARKRDAGDYAASIKYLRSFLQIYPHSAVALNELAFSQASLGLKESLESAVLANQKLPKNTAVLDTLAFAQIVNGKTADAEQTLRTALDIDPELVALSIRLTGLLIDQNRLEDSKQVFTKVMMEKASKAEMTTLAALKAKLSLSVE
jgi:cellulose synthase operon protein C